MRFPRVYEQALAACFEADIQKNNRTGIQVMTLDSGLSFVLDLSDEILPTPGLRVVWPHVAAAELAWFLSGDRDINWLRQYAGIWDKFVEDDGVTVANAYGFRWRWYFKRDQIAGAVAALKLDPADRRVYVSAWDPGRDGLGNVSKNVPCPVGFALYRLSGKVHMSVFLRSLDIFVGLPYDVMDFSLLLHAFAKSLHCETGTLRLTAANAHLYECHWDMAKHCLTQISYEPALTMPDVPVLTIPIVRDEYVDCMRSAATKLLWPPYSPKPEVVA